ncbi:hypothetical protein ACH4MW_24170 [Streptomyces luteogriseus]|uniref:hypothetical protein n=1 Tax=Streptomyces luteogriseus TaxID=68233 RepID=UPI0037AFB7FB
MDTAPRTVQANGITQAYRVWGPQDAEPLVLLHARGADGLVHETRPKEFLAAVGEFLSPAARTPS